MERNLRAVCCKQVTASDIKCPARSLAAGCLLIMPLRPIRNLNPGCGWQNSGRNRAKLTLCRIPTF